MENVRFLNVYLRKKVINANALKNSLNIYKCSSFWINHARLLNFHRLVFELFSLVHCFYVLYSLWIIIAMSCLLTNHQAFKLVSNKTPQNWLCASCYNNKIYTIKWKRSIKVWCTHVLWELFALESKYKECKTIEGHVL